MYTKNKCSCNVHTDPICNRIIEIKGSHNQHLSYNDDNIQVEIVRPAVKKKKKKAADEKCIAPARIVENIIRSAEGHSKILTIDAVQLKLLS